MKYLTWFDIDRKISQYLSEKEYPDGIYSIYCSFDVVEVYIDPNRNDDFVIDFFIELFGDWFDQKSKSLLLDINDSKLPLRIIKEKEEETKRFIPKWSKLKYLSPENTPISFNMDDTPHAVTFHSFKGGVGRTLHLIAFVLGLIKKSKAADKSINILIVDADIEAPGITFLLENRGEVSFLKFLEAYHYPPDDNIENVFNFFANEIRENQLTFEKSTIFILPAFIEEKDLLDIRVYPEHIANKVDTIWDCSKAIKNLGKKLNAEYIFIDLRAGLSEISSPFVLDKSLELFLVTSLSKQSLNGISLILDQLKKIGETTQVGYDPQVILSMLTRELKDNPDFSSGCEALYRAYNKNQDSDKLENEGKLEIHETFFHDSLLYIKNWKMVLQKLEATTLLELGEKWASNYIEITNDYKLMSDKTHEYLTSLKKVCDLYLYAEKALSDDRLITHFFSNLKNKYKTSLPVIVSIGSKGAGKTFSFIQLARYKYWKEFLKMIDSTIDFPANNNAFILPFIQSTNLSDDAKKITDEARLLVNKDFHFSDIDRKIKQSKHESKEEWEKFWIKEMAYAAGVIQEESEEITLQELDNRISRKGNEINKIIYIIDGLEDIFQEIPNQEQGKRQRIALKSLLDISNYITDIREPSIGLIIFIRRDFLSYIITQNFGQLEAKYKEYDLVWDADSFLKLVYWLCKKSNIELSDQIDDVNSAGREDIIEALKRLWGLKLGTNNAREAYSTRWVYAALSDYNGQLQARDIVRLLYFSAEIALDKKLYNSWDDRIIPPSAIRDSIKKCSEEKVSEMAEENLIFGRWKDKIINLTNKKIPSSMVNLQLSPEDLQLLVKIGVIFEDKNLEGDNLYIPEIYRRGLDFKLEQGARPRVLVRQKKIF